MEDGTRGGSNSCRCKNVQLFNLEFSKQPNEYKRKKSSYK